ncbi:MAG: glycosyltransferase family 2 protein [Acidobacteria bacterium]|nr:glycosyltransferase family 2 protein [Acidobacteriota bacterium]
MHLSVIIPAYNEEQRLPGTLQDVERFLERQPFESQVLVVDDGSTDGTAQVAREREGATGRVRLLRHADRANHGKGAAVRLGMSAALGRFRLFMDADNSTGIDQVERFWSWFDRGYDIVIGSRNVPGSEIAVRQAWYKELAGRFGNIVVRTLAVPGIRDTQAGFKAFSAESAGVVFPRLTIDRWGYDFEALAVARAHGFKIREVPITWANSPGSKVNLKSYFQVLMEVIRVRRNVRSGRYR